MRVIFIMFTFLMIPLKSNHENKGLITSCNEALTAASQNNLSNLNSDKNKLSKDVKSAWFELIFEINKINSLQNYLVLLDDLERVASLRYQAGDIDLLQNKMLDAKVAEAMCDLTESQIKVEVIKNNLNRLLYSDFEIIPKDSMLTMYEINRYAEGEGRSDDLSDRVFLNDSINNGFQEFTLKHIIEILKLNLDKYFTRIRFFQDTSLINANLSLYILTVQFQAEEIDYLEYTDKLKEVFNVKLEFLETLNNYNQTAIQLEYYEY